MKAERGTPCYFCKCPMEFHQVKPLIIFDIDKAEILGLAHSTCTRKAKQKWYATKPINWGEESPSPEIILFGCRMARALRILQDKGPSSIEFHVRLLLNRCLWKTADLEECLKLKDVRGLLDHWVNGPMKMDPERAEQIKSMFRTILKKEG